MKSNENTSERFPLFNHKYRTDNGFALWTKPKDVLCENYWKFKETISSFSIKKKLKDINEKFAIFTENNDDEDENDKINLEIEDIKNEYNKILNESKENTFYYDFVIIDLLSQYDDHKTKESKRILDKTTTEIICLVNNQYYNYEQKLINIVNKLNNLNLKLNNKIIYLFFSFFFLFLFFLLFLFLFLLFLFLLFLFLLFFLLYLVKDILQY